MTTVTYGHGYLTDCNDTTGWTEARNNMIDADATLEVIYDDEFRITAIFDNGATGENCSYTKDITDISSDVYTKYLLRYKTSESANGAHAGCVLTFSSGTQTILDNAYSTSWKLASGDITTGKTITHVAFTADDDGTDGTFYVYYDFLLLYKDDFTFPSGQPTSIEFRPNPRYALLASPARLTDITQSLGNRSAEISMECDLDIGTWTRTGDDVDAEVFYDIAHNSVDEPFQWLDTENEQLKVTLEEPVIKRLSTGDSVSRILNLTWREYSRKDKSTETCTERFGLDQ